MIPAVLALGQAGVHRVASELLLRQVGCSVPLVDTGADLILSTGARVQVKATRLRRLGGSSRSYPSSGPAYRFRLGRSKARGKSFDNKARWEARQYSVDADFVVLWGVDENRFWIVPSGVMDGRACLVLPSLAVPYQTRQQGTFTSAVLACENGWDAFLPAPVQAVELIHKGA